MKGHGDKRNHESMPGHAPIGLEEAFILASNVERRRKAQKLTKQKFALMAGISRPTLDKIEKGHPKAQLEAISKIASALGATTAELLTPPKKQ